jgi:hypothetical protein
LETGVTVGPLAAALTATRYDAAMSRLPSDSSASRRACECDGYRFIGTRKHFARVERRSEREGWPFGVICPLPRGVDAIALGLYGA